MAYTYEYPRPMVTVDAVILQKAARGYEVLLIERKHDPFAGHWALPGGFLDMDETPDAAAARELAEETGLTIDESMTQIGAFGAVNRDPRGRTIGIAYGIVLAEGTPTDGVRGQDDARQAAWHSIDHLPNLAFDHAEIMKKAIEVLLS